jgi:thiol:disulfide interchange protein DsbD
MSFTLRALFAVSLALFPLPPSALAQVGDNGREMTQRALIAEVAAAEAGKPFYAAFHFTMDDDAHMYWRFAGGVGDPFVVREWELPPGWTVEAVEYPLPHVLPDPEAWTSYVYGREVLFPVKITPSSKFTSGAVKLRAKVAWQICRDKCFKGADELELSLVAGAAKPANTELFARWLAQLPRTEPPPVGEVKFEYHGRELSVRVGGLPKDAQAEFFVIPAVRPKFKFEMRKTPTVESAEDGMRVFRFPFASELPWSGLLVLTGADGVRRGWYLGDPPAVEVESPPRAVLVEDDGETWDPFDAIAKGENERRKSEGWWTLLLQGFLGGLLLNLMPCVLPVISLKIFGFVRQAGEAKERIFKLGLAFCAGVFGFFLALALLVLALASANTSLGWGAQFSNPVALTVMIAVMFVFGLSLLGVFEITLGGAESKLSDAAGKEGYGGALVHGFFTTLLGTSCTAPLVGSVLGAAVNQPGVRIFALFFAIASGLSLPYFLLTWKPAWMRFLPKPGMWMVRFKQVLGFVMLGFAAWLLRSLPGAPMVVAVASFLLVLGGGAWLLSSWHGRRWALPAALALGAAGWFLFIDGVVRPPASPPSGLLAEVRKGLNAGRPVFVDFTAEWCLNCKTYENLVLDTDPVHEAIKEKNVHFVKADYTQQPPDIAAALRKIGRAGVPVYVLFRKRDDYWLADGLTQAGLLEELRKL